MTHSSLERNNITNQEERQCYNCGYGKQGDHLLFIEYRKDMRSTEDKPVLRALYKSCDAWIAINCEYCCYRETCTRKENLLNIGCVHYSHTPSEGHVEGLSPLQFVFLESMGFCQLPIDTRKQIFKIASERFATNTLQRIVFLQNPTVYPPPPPERLDDNGETLVIHNLLDETVYVSKESTDLHPYTRSQQVLSFSLVNE